MREALETAIRELWQGAETTPDIIVALEQQGLRVSEKRVLDTARDLGMKGSDVHSTIFNNPTLIEEWWKRFEAREEQSALELVKAKSVKGAKAIGRARHVAGCCVADELAEKGAKAGEITVMLKKRGFENSEIERIRKEVGF